MKNKCDLCNEKKVIFSHWVLGLYDLPNYYLCEECDLNFDEQIFDILKNETNMSKMQKGMGNDT